MTFLIKILLTGVSNSLNNGGMAIVVSAIEALRKDIPEANFTILSDDPVIDEKRYMQYGIRVVGRRFRHIKVEWRFLRIILIGLLQVVILLECIVWRIVRKQILPFMGDLREFIEHDIVIDLNGDSLTEDYGTVSLMGTLYEILLGVLCGKPTVLYAQSIGPFRSPLNRFLAKLIIDKVSLITVREDITLQYLQHLGIVRPKIKLTADSAFLLNQAPNEDVERILEESNVYLCKHPVVGISPSGIIYRYAFKTGRIKDRKKKYVRMMAELADYLAENFGSIILLIPHVIAPGNDDRVICKETYEMTKNKHNVKLILKDCKADEVKGIIKKCDMLIGCRMHSAIASTSAYVPTIVLGYSQKSHGIIGRMLGLEDLVIDVGNCDFEKLLMKLKEQTSYVLSNLEPIRDHLKQKVDPVKECALLNSKSVKKLLHSLGQM